MGFHIEVMTTATICQNKYFLSSLCSLQHSRQSGSQETVCSGGNRCIITVRFMNHVNRPLKTHSPKISVHQILPPYSVKEACDCKTLLAASCLPDCVGWSLSQWGQPGSNNASLRGDTRRAGVGCAVMSGNLDNFTSRLEQISGCEKISTVRELIIYYFRSGGLAGTVTWAITARRVLASH